MSDDAEHQYVTSIYVDGFQVEGLEFNSGWRAQTRVFHRTRDWITVRSVGGGLSLEGALLSLSKEIVKELEKP